MIHSDRIQILVRDFLETNNLFRESDVRESVGVDVAFYFYGFCKYGGCPDFLSYIKYHPNTDNNIVAGVSDIFTAYLNKTHLQD